MELRLTSYEIEKLTEAQNILLSPFDYASRAEWLLECLATIRDLVGADAGVAQDPDDPQFAISSEYPKTFLAPYKDAIVDTELRFVDHSRFAALGIWNRRTAFANDLDAFYGSRYYNEYVVPARAFDATGLAVSLAGRDDLTDTLMLIFHHHNPTGRQFGERGLALLRLIYPAFRAGAQILARAEARRESTEWIIDAIGDRLRLYDLDGNVLLESREMMNLLSYVLPNSSLSDRLDAMARRVIRAAVGNGRAIELEPEEIVQTAQGRFRIRSVWTPGGVLHRQKCLLLVVHPLDGMQVDLDDLVHHFGFTRREAEVALLLSRRKSNREIARTLVISEHTARHHTEHVMAKLGVHSRREVRDRLAENPSGTNGVSRRP